MHMLVHTNKYNYNHRASNPVSQENLFLISFDSVFHEVAYTFMW